MPRLFCRPLLHTLVVILISMALTACGDEREKKVLAQTEEASKTVYAEKTAADIANSAQQILADSDISNMTNPELYTVRCGSEATNNLRVLSFIPRTAKIAPDATLPGNMASRVKSDLTQRFGASSLVTSVPSDCPVTMDEIAVNSPILLLDKGFANQGQAARDNDKQVVSVTMEPCGVINGKQVPGVKITKILKDGTRIDPKASDCGTVSKNLDQFELTSKDLPDWKARLSGTDPNANTSILCIKGKNVSECKPYNDADAGTQVVCDSDSDVEKLMANPKFNESDAAFYPDSSPRNCGKGWAGEMIARLKVKNCTVKRSNGESSVPATVIDVAYVGAKCTKENVALEDYCPAGTPFAATGRVLANKRVVMKQPVSLLPAMTDGKNKSSIVYKYTDSNNQVVTNADDATATLQSTTQTVVRAPTTGNASPKMDVQLFSAGVNLNSISDQYKFDAEFVATIADGLKEIHVQECYPLAQTCAGGDPLEIAAIVVDRSGSMTGGGREITPAQTSCRATMANLFKTEKMEQACIAARAWQNISESKYQIYQKAIAAWKRNGEPVYQGSQLYEALVEDADGYIQSGLYKNEQIMIEALENPANAGTLKSALVRGQDCYPTAVQDNMYGSCSQMTATAGVLAKGNFTLNGDDALLSCQSSCPGVCVTDAVSRVRDINGNGRIDGTEAAKASNGDFTNKFIPSKERPWPTLLADQTQNYLPVSMPTANRMMVVDTFVKQNLLTNLPYGVKLYYSEFYDNKIDDANAGNTGQRPVDLTLDQDNRTDNNVIYNTNMVWWWKKVFDAIDDKFKARNAGQYPAYGGTPLYKSIDPAIDKMIEKRLGAKPDAPGVLIVLSDGADTAGGSRYFGSNFCEADAPLAAGYQCQKCRDTGKNSRDCSQKLAIDRNDVQKKYGIEYSETRKQWCQSRGYDYYEERTGNSPVRGQENSLVGIIGRNFPNTKIFYLGIDGGMPLANNCKDKIYYRDPNTTIRKQILYTFAYDDSASDQITDAFQKATGGGSADLETGKKICKMAYNDGIDMNENEPPYKVGQTTVSSGNQILPPNCSIKYLNVNAPPGTEVLPPDYVPDPIFPPVGYDPYGNPYDYGDCIPYGPYDYSSGYYNGYLNDGTMRPCKARR